MTRRTAQHETVRSAIALANRRTCSRCTLSRTLVASSRSSRSSAAVPVGKQRDTRIPSGPNKQPRANPSVPSRFFALATNAPRCTKARHTIAQASRNAIPASWQVASSHEKAPTNRLPRYHGEEPCRNRGDQFEHSHPEWPADDRRVANYWTTATRPSPYQWTSSLSNSDLQNPTEPLPVLEFNDRVSARRPCLVGHRRLTSSRFFNWAECRRRRRSRLGSA